MQDAKMPSLSQTQKTKSQKLPQPKQKKVKKHKTPKTQEAKRESERKKRAKQRAKSPEALEYKKQRARVQAMMRNAKKRGYIWTENPIPEVKPGAYIKDYKKAIKKLKELTPPKLYAKALYTRIVKPSTGEIATGTEGRAYERKQAAAKSKRTKAKKKEPEEDTVSVGEAVFDRIEMVIQTAQPKNIQGIALIEEGVKKLIDEIGKEKAAEIVLADGPDFWDSLDFAVRYSGHSTWSSRPLAHVLNVLEQRPRTQEELADISEITESWDEFDYD